MISSLTHTDPGHRVLSPASSLLPDIPILSLFQLLSLRDTYGFSP